MLKIDVLENMLLYLYVRELVLPETCECLFQICEVNVGGQVAFPRTVEYIHDFVVFEGLVTLVQHHTNIG